MKPIIVKESNFEKISLELDQVQGRCSERTVSPEDIRQALEYTEKQLDIPRAHMKGVKVRIDLNAQNFAKAYKYEAKSTIFYAEHTGSAWKLTDVERDTCLRAVHKFDVTLTDEAKAAVIKSVLNRL